MLSGSDNRCKREHLKKGTATVWRQIGVAQCHVKGNSVNNGVIDRRAATFGNPKRVATAVTSGVFRASKENAQNRRCGCAAGEQQVARGARNDKAILGAKVISCELCCA